MEYFVKGNSLQLFRNQQGSTWRQIGYGRSTLPQFNDHRQCGFSRTHDYEECWWSNNVPVSLAALGFHWPLINHGTKLWTGSGQTDSEVQDRSLPDKLGSLKACTLTPYLSPCGVGRVSCLQCSRTYNGKYCPSFWVS